MPRSWNRGPSAGPREPPGARRRSASGVRRGRLQRSPERGCEAGGRPGQGSLYRHFPSGSPSRSRYSTSGELEEHAGRPDATLESPCSTFGGSNCRPSSHSPFVEADLGRGRRPCWVIALGTRLDPPALALLSTKELGGPHPRIADHVEPVSPDGDLDGGERPSPASPIPIEPPPRRAQRRCSAARSADEPGGCLCSHRPRHIQYCDRVPTAPSRRARA